jgi:hypothetical protein
MNGKIVLFAAASLLQATLLSAGEKMSGQIATNVGRLLELDHYSGRTLGPKISERILESYLEDLDADKDFFTQGDLIRGCAVAISLADKIAGL